MGADKPLIGGFFTGVLKRSQWWPKTKKLPEMGSSGPPPFRIPLYRNRSLDWVPSIYLDWDFKRGLIAVMLGVIL